MRRLRRVIGVACVILSAWAIQVGGQPAAAQSQPPAAHLVLVVQNDGDARLNRMDWDVNAWSPLFPGTGVRASDYIDLSGRTTLSILCADLVLIEQRGSEVPRCDPYASSPVFVYVDDPAWTVSEGTATIVVASTDPASIPPEVLDPGRYTFDPLAEDEAARVNERVNAIQALNLPTEAKAFALSSLYRNEGMVFDAIAALTALPDLGCSARRPSVEPPTGTERLLLQSPALYLRLGELFQVLGQMEDAARYYRCATELSTAIGDPANLALAYARQGDIATDTTQAIQFYQLAINSYASLGAFDPAKTLLEICGSRNCTLP